MREPQRSRFRAVEVEAFDGVPEAIPQFFLKCRGVRGSFFEVGLSVLGCDTGSDDHGDIFCSSPKFVFLHAAVYQRFNACAPLFVKNPHAFRPVKTVGRQREQIDAELRCVDREPTPAERGVDKQRDTSITCALGSLGDRLNGAKIVTGMVQANEGGVVSQRLAKRINVNPPLAIDGQSRALEPLTLKPSDGTEHGRVLDGGGDDVFAKPSVGQGGSLHGKVDGLCSAARENNLLHFSGVHKLGQARTSFVECVPRLQTELVQGAGGPKALAEPRPHRLGHLGERRSRGKVIEMDHGFRHVCAGLFFARLKRTALPPVRDVEGVLFAVRRDGHADMMGIAILR